MQEEVRSAASGRHAPELRAHGHTEFRSRVSPHISNRSPPRSSAFPELDCIRDRLSTGVVTEAERRAAALGIGADRVLIATGAISDEAYCRALASNCGLLFEPLDTIPRSACPLAEDRLIEAAARGLLPLYLDNELVVVIAPQTTASRYIATQFSPRGSHAIRIRLTS